jgi:hypothetical protein
MDAEQIVRALAAIEGQDMECYGDCGCPFCGVFTSEGDHDPACLWRLAREWVVAQAIGTAASDQPATG